MNKKTLTQLYSEHDGKLSDKWSLYLSEYDVLLNEFRDKPVSMLEIGVQNGGSLEIWSKYFNNPKILLGCDINPDCALLTYNNPCIDLVIGDANADSTRDQILRRCVRFDIIIDDGSHRSNDIIKSFATYFPFLAEGGLFIIEDLHCSYWQQFEGGLFDPYSSISFFKRLADVVNYEHWGVPKRRDDIFRGIFAKYNCDVDVEFLSQVYSITFLNSMCIVRKCLSGGGGLGYRVTAGSHENIFSGLSEFNKLPYKIEPIFDQTCNAWACRKMPPDEELSSLEMKMAECDKLIVNLNKIINDFKTSNSWRLTKPLRAVSKISKSIRCFINDFVAFFCRNGIKLSLSKIWGVLRNEGLNGIGSRLVSRDLIYVLNQNFRKKYIPEKKRVNYDTWISQYDTINENQREDLIRRVQSLPYKPKISILMPVFDPKPEFLRQAIESVRSQLYDNWELCIADDASTLQEIRDLLSKYEKEDSRIRLLIRDVNGHISQASNSALTLVTGDFIALLDHDDLLTEHALLYVAEAIVKHPNAGIIYSDEDKIDSNLKRCQPYFKPDWNKDLFLSHNYICHLGVYRTSLVKQLGGWKVGYEGGQDYDLALRCIENLKSDQIIHIPRVLYHWRLHPASTSLSTDIKPYALLNGMKALQDYMKRNGIKAQVEQTEYSYRIRYELPETLPLVSIIVPTRNGLKFIKQCVESILAKTSYLNFEILIIDNASDEEQTLSYLNILSNNPKIRVIRDERPFNYSALNNAAVKQINGEYVCLLNNDIEVIKSDWLTEMMGLAIQPGVGAVGACLLYPNGRIQHGGVILGLLGIAGHSHKMFPRNSPGYFGRLKMVSNFSAVTGACLLIKKTIYEEVGGLNETDLQVAFNDVDFCLRVKQAGYRNVWTPFAELYHHESATRGRDETSDKQARLIKEANYMAECWGEKLVFDPAYSPNLTLDYDDFSFAWPPRWSC